MLDTFVAVYFSGIKVIQIADNLHITRYEESCSIIVGTSTSGR